MLKNVSFDHNIDIDLLKLCKHEHFSFVGKLKEEWMILKYLKVQKKAEW